LPGRHDDVVRVFVHTGQFPLTWKLGLHSAQALRESSRCPSPGTGGAGGGSGSIGTGGGGTGGGGTGRGGLAVDGGAAGRDGGPEATGGAGATGGGGGDPCPAACDDGDPCTSDVCQSRGCLHLANCLTFPMGCRVEVCVVLTPTTFTCVTQTSPDGASCQPTIFPTCSDTNICKAGNCVAATPACGSPPPNDCVGPSACINGSCQFPALPGPSRRCNGGDLCVTGSCMPTGIGPVAAICHIPPQTWTCFPTDRCHKEGICEPSTGVCTPPPVSDGTPCPDGDPCNGEETCQAGVCTAGEPVASCGSTNP
jgi:hypothetical protein